MYEEMLKDMFPTSRWDIVWAEKPTEAVEKFEDSYFDCILIDYEISSGFTGRDFLRWIRAEGGEISGTDKHTPIFLFSQYKGEKREGFSAYDVNKFNAEKEFIYKEDVKGRLSGPGGSTEIREWTQSLFEDAMIPRCTPKLETEYEPLETVLVHKPTDEITRVDPDHLEAYLLEEPLHLNTAQQQHRRFLDTLAEAADRPTILDTKRLLFEVVRDANEDERREWLSRILLHPEIQRLRRVFANSKGSSHLTSMIGSSERAMSPVLEDLLDKLSQMDAEKITSLMLRGLTISEVFGDENEDVQKRDQQVVPPVSNLYFMRDPAFTLGNRVFLSQMYWPVRRRETSILRLIFNEHPFFRQAFVEELGERQVDQIVSVEGGDVMAIKPGVYAIAESERTDRKAIEEVARTLLEKGNADRIYQPRIPVKRAFIHLDTVCSLAGPDYCVVHSEATEAYASTLCWRNSDEPDLLGKDFVSILEEEFGFSRIETSDRQEQRQDATNVLMADPETVVAYERNENTNDDIKDKGLNVAEFKGGELVKGLGGPRCMTMPIRRGEL